MKRSALLLACVGSFIALVASAVTPTPRPSASAKPSGTPQLSDSSSSTATPKPPPPEDLPSPSDMKITAASTPAANAAPPKPVLYLIRTEPYTVNGKNFIRYRYDVFNKMEYPAEMFAAAPSLPPCGLNTNASRTWVDFFDSTGKRLYGFCALGKPEDLGKLWFALEEGVVPPSYVYIELNDRQTNTKYKSNLADTTI
jgi:hypothetical protein